jgi:hypothetical protein
LFGLQKYKPKDLPAEKLRTPENEAGHCGVFQQETAKLVEAPNNLSLFTILEKKSNMTGGNAAAENTAVRANNQHS